MFAHGGTVDWEFAVLEPYGCGERRAPVSLPHAVAKVLRMLLFSNFDETGGG